MGASRHPKSGTGQALRTGGLEHLVMLGAEELRAVLTPAVCLAALEDAYRRLHDAPGDAGQSVGFQAGNGKFHVKAGLYPGTHEFFAAKVNANFPSNDERHGLPTIQGLIVLCDGGNGCPLAIMQSGELTGLRTAAATALAAKHGARPQSRTLAVIGCGAQARYQVDAIAGVLPITNVAVYDHRPGAGGALARWASGTLGLEAGLSPSIAEAASASDIIVTCTTAREPILVPGMIPPGCFIAAVGADNPDKQELDPRLFAGTRVIVDDLGQCSVSGDLAHAIRAGIVRADDVAGSLADLVSGACRGRESAEEIVIFDSTGTGLQDVAAAAAAYKAIGTG